jgi:hypothetical protein
MGFCEPASPLVELRRGRQRKGGEMVNKNDDEKMTVGELLQALARVLYELELAHEIVKELAKHLSVSEEK